MMVARGRELDREDGHSRTASHADLARPHARARVSDRRSPSARRRHARSSAVIESAPDYVFHLALDGSVLFANRVDENFRMENLVGSTVESFLSAEHQQTAKRARDRVLEPGLPQGYDVPVQQPDGKMKWYSSRIAPIRQQGEITGFVVISRDVTEAKQTEMHLMVADRMASVGTLAAGVAHEINNPLAYVIANLDMALQDVKFKRELPAGCRGLRDRDTRPIAYARSCATQDLLAPPRRNAWAGRHRARARFDEPQAERAAPSGAPVSGSPRCRVDRTRRAGQSS